MMNSVAKNAAWIIGCKIAQSVLAFVINMFTARYLGPSNYGVITYASSLVAFAVPLMQLGFNNILVQELVHHPEREGKTLGTTMFLSMCSSFACIVGIVAFAYVANLGDEETVIVCALYSGVLVFQALEQLIYWFQSKLMSQYTSIISLIAYVCISAYRIYLLATAKSVYWFAVSNAFDICLISLGTFIMYRKLKGQKLTFSFDLGKQLFSKSKHYILSSMMVTIFAQTDKIMLKAMINKESTAYYGAALACAAMTGFVFQAVIDSFRPFIFEGQKISDDLFKHRLQMLYSLVIYLSLLQSVVMTICAEVVVWITYGLNYMDAVTPLRIVVWYTTFAYLGSVRNIWILANSKQKYLWIINLSGAIANVVLNVCLIPFLGVNGAAIASLVTQFFTNVIIGFIIKPIRPNNSIMLKSLNPQYCLDAAKRVFTKKK